MSKITNMVMFILVLMLLFHMAGLMDKSGSGVIMNILLHPENIKNTTFWSAIQAAILMIATMGAIIGTFAGIRLGIIIKVGILSTIILAIGLELSSLFVVLNANVGTWFATLIISPMLIIFLIAAMEWWQ